MKRYFTRTGIELFVIQGEGKVQPVEASQFSSALEAFAMQFAPMQYAPGEVPRPMTSKDRYVVGFDATSTAWFVEDRWSESIASIDYDSYNEAYDHCEKLNRESQGA